MYKPKKSYTFSGKYLFHIQIQCYLSFANSTQQQYLLLPRNTLPTLQEAAMGSPVSPIISSIYIDYFGEIVLGSPCPISTPWWKRFMDYIISIVQTEQVDTLFNHINFVDPYM